jgi:predicted RNase H-like HicB family nuclease
MVQPIIVNAIWDAENKVWVAESEEVPGLATGADTLEELVEKLKIVIPELLAENGVVSATGRLLFKVEAERSEYTSIAA